MALLRLFAQRIRYRILGGYILILGVMLLVLLLAIGRLAAYSDSVAQSITQASPHIELGSAVAQQIATARLRVAQYLRTQAPADYNETTIALGTLGSSIDDALAGLSDPAQITPLNQVHDSYVTYVDTFRKLVGVISAREQLYITLLNLQTTIETRLQQLQHAALTRPTPDVQAIEAGSQVIAHIQLAGNEMTELRLQQRQDSVIWLRSELSQIQLWFTVLDSHSASFTDDEKRLYSQVNAYETEFQQRASEFLTLHERDEQQARASLEQVGIQLEQHSNVTLNQTLSALTGSVYALTQDASTAQRVLLLVLVVAAVVSVAASVVLTINLTRPLRDLSQVAQAVSAGDLGIRARIARPDEIGQLAAAFDQMTDGLQRSLETERAANEQIRLQTAQIARQTQATAVTEERQRIARELHDSVKQQLFSICLSAGAALNLLSSDLETARVYLEHVKRASREAQVEMKNLLLELVPAPLQEHRLDEALRQYLEPLCRVHDLQLIWIANGTNTLLPTHEHALFRAAQEAIANVIRHSGAHHLRVTLDFGRLTTLVVEDDGCGFDPDDILSGSTGLSTMRVRLDRVGGAVDVRTEPGRGTRIQMTVNSEIARTGEAAA